MAKTTPPASPSACLATYIPLASQSLQSTRDAADKGNLPVGQPHDHSSWTTKESAGGGNGSNDATSPVNPGVHHLSPPGGESAAAAAVPAAARWGAGLSEQVQTALNHGRAKVNGVVTRYSHLQHVKVRSFCAGERGGAAPTLGVCWLVPHMYVYL